MALAPYNITALEEDFATAQLSGKNIVAGALITLATTGGTPVLMADDSAGSNPSLTKLTDALGQKVIWVETDVYDLTVDGNASIRIEVTSNDISTATQAALDLKVDATAVSNVDNTSDLNKPVSTATQTALDLKAATSSLGTASTANVTTSTQDNTAGSILKVGDWDIGTNTWVVDAANKRVAVGWAEGATAARINIPINFVSPPSSITVTGTFRAKTTGLAIAGTGLTPSFFANGCNKIATLVITGLTGLTTGETVTLESESATSKIVVNA